MSNIIIAGGSIDYLCNGHFYNFDKNIDIDIFIFADSFKKFYSKIYYLIEKFKEHKNIVIEFTDRVINIFIYEHMHKIRKIQIICKFYMSIFSILDSFDLGSSQICFYDNKFYCTKIGHFSYKYRCNILDLTKRTKSYEYRLKKYLKRGFNIILPNLDISKVKNFLNLKFLPYQVIKIKENNIFVSEIEINKIENISDYSDVYSYYNVTKILKYILKSKNMFYIDLSDIDNVYNFRNIKKLKIHINKGLFIDETKMNLRQLFSISIMLYDVYYRSKKYDTLDNMKSLKNLNYFINNIEKIKFIELDIDNIFKLMNNFKIFKKFDLIPLDKKEYYRDYYKEL